MLDPDVMEPEEARAIGDWVRAGGRLVAGGRRAAWLDAVLDEPPRWRPTAGDAARRSRPSRDAGVRRSLRATAAAGASSAARCRVLGPARAAAVTDAQRRGAA